MSTDHKYFMVFIFFVILFFVSTSISYVSYCRNLSKYKLFLDNYKKSSLFIDSITKLSENLGFVYFYFKMVFFIRLLKNKKMYAIKGVLVDQAFFIINNIEFSLNKSERTYAVSCYGHVVTTADGGVGTDIATCCK